MLLRLVSCGLFLLAVSDPASTQPETLLSVTVTPGYTSMVSAELVRGHPLCLLRQDGTLIACEQASRPGEGMYYRAFTGVVPAADLERIQKALPLLLPPPLKPGSNDPVIVDAGRVVVHMRVGRVNEERQFMRLEPNFDELLRRGEMPATELAALDARTAFSAFVDGLRQRYARQVYVPKRARIFVETVAGAAPVSAPAWPIAKLSLPELQKQCGTQAKAKFVEVTDAVALAALANVVSSRQWSAGGAVYCVHWAPVIEP
jgi:hypothetical protein